MNKGLRKKSLKGAQLSAPFLLAAMLVVTGFSASAEPASIRQTPFGYWDKDGSGLPVFVYTMDECNDQRALYLTSYGPSNDHWHLLGNGHLLALAYNHGEVMVYSGERGSMWLNEREPKHQRFAGGYGFLKDGDTIISMRYPDRPAGCNYERRFGVGYFEKELTCPDLRIKQTIIAPRGDETALISQVVIENLSDRPKTVTWFEYWDVNPYYFGTMIEIAGEEGESTGEGEGLSSLSPLVGRLSKIMGSQFTLSRLFMNLAHRWRESSTKDFLLSTEKIDNALVARLYHPEPPVEREDRAELDYYPPAFFLAPLVADKNFDIFETDRRTAFDHKGRFTGHAQGGLIKEQSWPKAQICLVGGRRMKLPARGSAEFSHLVGYSREKDLEQEINRVRRKLSDQDPGVELPVVDIGDDRLNQEMIWHAYYLKALATYDEYFKSRIISQGCSYQYLLGLNIAARDPLQHMLPAVYLEPELAKDVLRYTLAEMDLKGFIPYGIKGVGIRTGGGNPFPSDTNLYLMLALAEYVSATRDFAFLDEVLPYYPKAAGKSGTVMEHMQKAWRHQIEDVGIGAHGLIKLRNSDWNDSFLAEEAGLNPGLDLARVEAEAESMLNTAMATYIFPRFADLVRAHGDQEWAIEIETRAEKFKSALMEQWNCRWFKRAILPGDYVVGDDRMYLSLQPWAMLGDVLDTAQELALDDTLHEELSSRSPIGAVMRWPPYEKTGAAENQGEGTNGGVWYSLRFPLIMAYARLRPDFAWEEFIKMSLHAHAEAYPETWIGLWSGPDAYNAPNSDRPGQAADVLPLSGGMNDFPVMCGHAHAAPWFSLIKLMGIHPWAGGYIIDPRMPADLQSWSMSTPLLELKKNGQSLQCVLRPRNSASMRFRVGVPEVPVEVKVNGKPAVFNIDGGFAVFTAAPVPGQDPPAISWELEW